MTKKFYAFILLFIVAITAAHAQRTVDLRIDTSWLYTSPGVHQNVTPYTQVIHDGVTPYTYMVRLTNLGPDDLKKDDTVLVKFGYGATGKITILSDTMMAMGKAMGVFAYNGSNPWVPFPVPPGKSIPFTDTVNWCDSVGLIAAVGNTPAVDPDPTNNYRCVLIKRSSSMWAVSVNEASLNENNLTIFPNPATESFTITFEAGATGNATVTLRDMTGKTVYTNTLTNASGTVTHSVDVGHLPSGLYTTELRYNDQTLVRKLTIQ